MQAGPDRRSCGQRSPRRASRRSRSRCAVFPRCRRSPPATTSLSATPYRPSVSTPAALSAPGWLEVEGGLQHSHVDQAQPRQRAGHAQARLHRRLGHTRRCRCLGTASRRESWRRSSGYGDTGVVLKRRFAVDDASAFGLEAGALLPTSRHGVGIGSGKADYGVNAIYSTDFASSWHTDLNLQPTRLGEIEHDTGRTLWLGRGFALECHRRQWTLIGEVSGSHRRGVDQQQPAAARGELQRLEAARARRRRSAQPAPGLTGLVGVHRLHLARRAHLLSAAARLGMPSASSVSLHPFNHETRNAHGNVWQEGRRQGRKGDAREEGGHAEERRLGQEGHQQEAGDRDRPLGGAQGRRQGPGQERRGQEVARRRSRRQKKSAARKTTAKKTARKSAKKSS